ncbi:S-methyl-5-thioribose-1-phosphate isomerase, partial [Amaricoccus sp. HAR-UPW-R2A-40]
RHRPRRRLQQDRHLSQGAGRPGLRRALPRRPALAHLMQRGQVDLVLVGRRVTAHGDVCNKIGTYLKALAARDCGVPFHVALP